MKCQRLNFLLLTAAITVISPLTACKSTPPAVTEAAVNSDQQRPDPLPPDQQPPDQDALDRLNAAMDRAERGREKALDVHGQVYFPDEWEKAESDNDAGKGTNKDTVAGVNKAIGFFESAADGYESIAEQSGPLYTQGLEDARKALEAAAARAQQSRKNASDNQGQTYFPADWRAAETSFKNGEDAAKDTLDEMTAAAELYKNAADRFDDIAGKSITRLARDKEVANTALQAAMARAEQSRKKAQDARAQNYFPDEWKTADTGMQSAKNARKNTPDEIKSATAQYTSAANTFDSIAEKSGPLFARDEAQKELTAAITRMERSKQQAADGQTYFPNDWRAAETREQSGRNAKKDTAEDIKAATAQIVAAAGAYDDIAQRSKARLAQDRDEANKLLQAAMARAAESRKQATGGQANFPDEWRAAEAKNQAATSAKKTNPAEMRAAVPLYNDAAKAYDDIVRKNTARIAEESQRRMREAMAGAEKERQAAIDAKAPISVPDDFKRANDVYQQAVAESKTNAYDSTTERFNQAASLFIASVEAIEKKRIEAEETIERAREISSESVARAANAMTENRHE